MTTPASRVRTAARRIVVPLVATALLLPLCGAGTAQAVPGRGAGSVQQEVAAMQAQVKRVGDALAARTIAYQADRDRLDVLLQQEYGAQRAADALALGAGAAQRQLNAVARAAYVSGVPENVQLAMSIDPRSLTRSLDTVASLERVGGTSRSALRLLLEQRAATTALAARRETLREQAQAVQARSDAALADLQAAAAKAESDLAAAQGRLAAAQRAAAERAAALRVTSRGSSLGASGPACSAPADGQYANGFLTPAVLCPLANAPGERLANGAAQAFDQLSALRRAQTGGPLCVTDSYRDYAGQVAVFAAKPSLAATPGRSQHGLGLAVDLCGGVERFASESFSWMKANAPSYGFVHPAWAEPGGGKPEPWHWEYVGS